MEKVNRAYKLVLPLCVVLGGIGMVAFLMWLIPVLGDFIHALNEDDKWIHVSVILFVGFVALSYHHLNQRKKDRDLLGTYDDKIKG